MPPPVVRDPLVRGEYLLLMGERRWAAAVRSGGPLIVYRIEDWWDLYAWMILDSQTRYLPGHEPMPVSAALAMTDRIRHLLQPHSRSNSDSIIAEYVGDGLTRKRLQELRQTYMLRGMYGSEIDLLIDREVALADRGLTATNTTYGRVKRAIDRMNAPEVSAQQQRKILNNSGQIGSGLIDGLQGLGPELDDTLSAGECAEWARQLSATRLKLEQVIRRLKERANG
jgi:hypothetical protein